MLFVGLDAAGRTTGLYQLVMGEVVTTIPTIGFNVETIEYHNVDICIWDVGGGDRIRPLFRHYYQGMQVLVYWIDSNDNARVESALYWLYRCLTELIEVEPELQLLIMLNKQDLPNAMTRDALLARLNTPTPATYVGPTWYQQDHWIPARPAMQELLGVAAGVAVSAGGRWQVQPCVATTGEGLHDGLDWLLGTGDDALREAAAAAAAAAAAMQ
jgi:GTPase SAR1 family protein